MNPGVASGQSVTIFNSRIPCAMAGAGKVKVAPVANDPAPTRTSRRLMAALPFCNGAIMYVARQGPVPREQIVIFLSRAARWISSRKVQSPQTNTGFECTEVAPTSLSDRAVVHPVRIDARGHKKF